MIFTFSWYLDQVPTDLASQETEVREKLRNFVGRWGNELCSSGFQLLCNKEKTKKL